MKLMNELLRRRAHAAWGLCVCAVLLSIGIRAQTPGTNPAIPEWAYPGSPGHKQVPPPADFRRASKTTSIPIGIFDGQTDVGSAIIPGSASYDPATKQYTIQSAGYNIWY